MPEKILVAVDGSDNGRKALDFAAEISAKIGGDLTIVHVLMHGRAAAEFDRLAEAEHIIRHTASTVIPNSRDLPPSMTEYLSHPEADRARAVAEIGDYLLRTAQETAEAAGARNVSTRSEDGDYADQILDVADEIGADLIVIGRRGLGRVRSLLLGSVSNKITQNAECSVLAVR